MNVLFLSRWYPYPANNGAKIRIYNLIKSLAVHHQVDLLSFTEDRLTSDRIEAMQSLCPVVDTVPYRPFNPRRLKAALGFFSPQPRSVIDSFSNEMYQRTERALQTRQYDALIASQIDTTAYIIKYKGPPKIFEEIELTGLYEQYTRQQQTLKRYRRQLMWLKYSHYIMSLLKHFEGCTAVSKTERSLVLQLCPGYSPIEVIPNGVDVAHSTGSFGEPEQDTLVYSGSLTYQANFDAVAYFLRDIFPLIRAKRPQTRLFITGKLDNVPVEKLPPPDNVIFTGYLDDIRPRVANSWVNVVPLRMGGGTWLKILESLALGTPVVATSKGAEGLELVPGRDILVADDPVDFAGAVLRLLDDPALRRELGKNGQKVVIEQYAWPEIGRQFVEFVESVAVSRSGGARR